MNSLPRAVRASRRRPRRGARAFCAGAGLTGAAAVALTGPFANPAFGATGVREDVVVQAADPDGSTTTARLLAGVQYELLVRGAYTGPSGAPADAECSATTLGVWSRERNQAPSLDLLVDGHDIDWSPTGLAVLGCDQDHTYRFSFTPSATGALQLRVDGGADQTAFTGALTVEVTGEAFAADQQEPAATEPAPASPAPTGDSDGTSAPGPAPQPSAPAGRASPPPSASPTTPPSPAPSPALSPAPSPAPAPVPAPGPAATPSTGTHVASRDELASLFLDDDEDVATRPPAEVELVIGPRGQGGAVSDGAVLAALVVAALVAGGTSIGVPVTRRAASAVARRRRPAPWRPGPPRIEQATSPKSAPSAFERSYFA